MDPTRIVIALVKHVLIRAGVAALFMALVVALASASATGSS